MAGQRVRRACSADGREGVQHGRALDTPTPLHASQKNHLWTNILSEMGGRTPPNSPPSRSPSASEVAGALVRGYERTDRGFMTAIRPAFDVGFGEVGRVGCCAVSVVIASDVLVVANAGDCRAVLGSKATPGDAPPSSAPSQTQPEQGSGGDAAHPLATAGALVDPTSLPSTPAALAAVGWAATPLSQDHNSRLEREQSRLRRAHPGEDDIVVCRSPTSCYVKGRLQPTRALGDMYLKYSEFNGRAGTRLYGRHVKAPYTPPYITATPQVQSHALRGGEDAFLLLACDGIWDVFSNEEAVAFVANDTGDPSTVSERLIAAVLAREAAAKGLTVEQLQAVRPGRVRRSMHDDMTAMVLWLDTPAGRDIVAQRTPKQAEAQGGGSSWWPFGGKPVAAEAEPSPQAAANATASAVEAVAAASGGLPVSISYVAPHPVSGATEAPPAERA